MVQSIKQARDRLRRELAAAGRTPAQIAVAMGQRFNERPRVAWRHALGWTQARLTVEFRRANPGMPIADGRISQWENWPHSSGNMTLEIIGALALAFGHGCQVSDLVDDIDLAHLSPARRQWLSTDTGAGTATASAVAPWTTAGGLAALAAAPGAPEDSTFLTLSAGVVVGMAHDWLAIQTPDVARAAGGRVGGELVASLQERLPALRRIDHTLGGLQARPLVDAELRLVANVLTSSSYSAPTGRALFAVAAELCRVAGWASCDAGQHTAAERYWSAGIRAAHLAGDRGIGANILKSWALQRTEAGQHAQAIALVDAALEGVRGGADQVRAMLTVRKARAHAARGDLADTERLLAAAETLLGRGRGDDAVPAWAGYFGQAEFDAQTAACYLLLGKHHRTDQLLERALALQPDERSRDRGTYTIWRAENSLDAGDVDAACTHIRTAVPDLVGARSARNRTRLAGVHYSLRAHHRLPIVRDLDEELRSLLQESPA